jgi:hypothetical protein
MNTPPPGHNADVSLLSGGTGQIVGVMGGGTRRNKNKRQNKSRRKSRHKSKSNRKKGGGDYNPFTLNEIQQSIDIPTANFKLITLKRLGVTGIPLITLPNEPLSVLNRNVYEYINSQKKQWKYHSSSGTVLTVAPVFISSDICSTINYPSIDGGNGVSGYDRLSIILPKETQNIVVFPPCYGNLITYGKCAEYINNNTDSNIVFIFAPPFYSREHSESDDNRTIFHHFIAMKKMLEGDGIASVYILSEYTNATVDMACLLTAATINKEAPLLPMLEPTYIIYPYSVNINGDSVSGILFSAAAHDEVILPESNIKSKSGLIDSCLNSVLGGHIFPPNTSKLDAKLNESSIPYRKYRFYSNKGEDILNTYEERVTIIKIGQNIVPELVDIEQSGGKPDDDRKFEAFKGKLFLKGVFYTSVPLGANQYSLRHPTTSVIEDWRNQKFTESEAKFLNELNLRPYILEEIYKTRQEVWQNELAENMAIIVRSKCFSDSRLVLHTDCQESQKFITDVLEYFVKHEARIASLEDDELETVNRELRVKYDNVKAKLDSTVFSNEDRTGWNKNPFTDGLIRATGQTISDPNMDYNIITRIVSREYIMTRSVTEKETHKETIGEIVCTFDEANEDMYTAKKILREKYNKINKEYKGWVIYP